MAKKKKKHHGPIAPPLSFLDCCIYWLGYFLLLVLLLTFAIGSRLVFVHYVFSDPNVIAAEESLSTLLGLPFYLYVLISGFIVLNTCHTDKKPIFGNKNVNYKNPRWKKTSPIFAKEKRQSHIEQRPSHIAFRKAMWRVWLIGFTVVTILLPFSFFGRDTYDCNSVFHRYDCVNRETATYSAKNVENLLISVSRRHKSTSYGICLTFRMESGRKVSFDISDFRGSRGESLEEMLRLKSQIPPERIGYANLHRMDRLMEQYSSDPYSTELVNKLFSLEEGSESFS